ncbi:MAG TPA: SDR family NAD(P)-dependent oxidoreductase, partial [Candidatus Eisenbacteria bacterium]
IHETAAAIESAGGRALAVRCDVREDDDLENVVAVTKSTLGRLDILIHNAGALWWTPVADTPIKRFDLVMQVNVRAAFVLTKLALPMLTAGGAGHVLVYSPPIELAALPGRTAYLISKFGMTMLALGLAGELREANVAANSLWPATAIETAATINFGVGGPATWRTPAIMADATLEIVATPPADLTGRQLLDEDVLRERGWTDFSRYRADPEHEPPRFALSELPRAAKVTQPG